MTDIADLVGAAVGAALREERRAVFELNRAQREGLRGLEVGGNPHAFGRKGSTQTWGRPFLRIHQSDLAFLVARNPALASRNVAEFTAAWLAFERSDESLPYRVKEDYLGPRRTLFTGQR